MSDYFRADPAPSAHRAANCYDVLARDGSPVVSNVTYSRAEFIAESLNDWATEFEAGIRARIADEIEALPNLSIRHFGTRPLPGLIRKDTAARIARGTTKETP